MTPKAVVSGYYANSNALDMVVPSAESTAEVMGNAIKRAGLTPADIAYVNTHGTSTPVGDPIELNGIKMVFGEDSRVAVNSTKSLTGHMIGAAGAVEAIFSMLMMENSFICKSANIEEIDPEAAWANIPREKVDISFDHEVYSGHDLLFAAHDFADLGELQKIDLGNMHIDLGPKHLGKSRRCVTGSDITYFTEDLEIHSLHVVKINFCHL